MVEPERRFAITVVMASSPIRSDLSAMASVLHRLGMEVVEAKLSAPTQGRREFRATFDCDIQRASTVRRSLQKVVNVLDVTLVDDADADMTSQGRQHCSAQGSSSVARPNSTVLPRDRTDDQGESAWESHE